MNTCRRSLFVVLLLSLSVFPMSPIKAQNAKLITAYQFFVPTGTPLVTGPDGDVLVYIAKPQGVVDVEVGCPSDRGNLSPLQNVLVLDPSGGRATRLDGVITTGAVPIPPLFPFLVNEPVPNGTRLGNLTLVEKSQCTTTSIVYDVYLGTVQ